MVKKLEYRIEQDRDPEMHPRIDTDNLGTMHCWHPQYNLGDEQHSKGTSEDFFFDMVEDQFAVLQYEHKDISVEKIEKAFNDRYIYLPLYLYDHSGITMNTGGFSCQWDSGQVGWIIVSKEKVRKEYDWKVITKKRIQQIESYLRNEVKTYDMYLTGDIWGFIIEDEEYDIYNSCWGFYGEEDCKQEAQSALDYEQEQLNEKLKVVPRKLNNLEFHYSVAGHKLLNDFLMEFWPNECRELDEILERGEGTENKILEEETDRYYEVVTFLKEVMRGSISRYFTSRRTA